MNTTKSSEAAVRCEECPALHHKDCERGDKLPEEKAQETEESESPEEQKRVNRWYCVCITPLFSVLETRLIFVRVVRLRFRASGYEGQSTTVPQMSSIEMCKVYLCRFGSRESATMIQPMSLQGNKSSKGPKSFFIALASLGDRPMIYFRNLSQ